MNEELNVLLQRILPPELKEPKVDQEPSRNLMVLLERVETRRWKEATEVEVAQQLETLRGQLAFIEHARNCRQCMAELQLSVERYGGSRGPWYLNLINEEADPEIYDDEETIYKNCPRPRDYKIGSYWTGTSDDTTRFILDRFTWAEGVMKGEVEAAEAFLAALKDWDLTSPLPPYDPLLLLGYR